MGDPIHGSIEIMEIMAHTQDCLTDDLIKVKDKTEEDYHKFAYRGAREFKRKFGGLCGRKKRDYEGAIRFLVEEGFTVDREEAAKTLEKITEKEITYSVVFNKTFTLKRYCNKEDGQAYYSLFLKWPRLPNLVD